MNGGGIKENVIRDYSSDSTTGIPIPNADGYMVTFNEPRLMMNTIHMFRRSSQISKAKR
jgi:hypothetical protein